MLGALFLLGMLLDCTSDVDAFLLSVFRWSPRHCTVLLQDGRASISHRVSSVHSECYRGGRLNQQRGVRLAKNKLHYREYVQFLNMPGVV